MPPAPKPAISISITDFPPAEYQLLRTAFHAFVPKRHPRVCPISEHLFVVASRKPPCSTSGTTSPAAFLAPMPLLGMVLDGGCAT